MCARHTVISISDLHQNDRRIGCLVAWQTTATGPTPRDHSQAVIWLVAISYMEGNAVCVQLAPPHSYAPLASPAETGRCSQQLSSLINASILVVLSRPWAGPLPAWLHPTISRYTGLRYRDAIFSHDTSPNAFYVFCSLISFLCTL